MSESERMTKRLLCEGYRLFFICGAFLVFSGNSVLAMQVSRIEAVRMSEFQRIASIFGGGQSRSGVYYEIPEVMLNVGPPTNGAFLKLRLTLELENEADLALAERLKPRLVDSFIWFLHNMRLEDFEGAGLDRVKDQLHERAERIVAPVKIRSVLLKELILQ